MSRAPVAPLVAAFLFACSSAPAKPVENPVPAPVAPVAAKTPTLTGIWLGTLDVGGGHGLRIQLHLDLAAAPPTCSLDSLDQGAMGIPCEHVVATATSLSVDVPAVHGTLTGTVSADVNTVTGTWSQGSDIPLVLTRQDKALAAATIAMDPEMPAVDVAKIHEVLDADLAKILPKLSAESGIGVTIGVIEHGKREVFSYGAVKPDSIFEIGSITKTFTGLALAQLVAQGKAKLDEPVRALLPKGTVAAPASGAEITLLDLSAQRSGLPRMPDNIAPADPENPYADYTPKLLYAYLTAHGVARPDGATFAYSNLGVGLLGHALALRAGKSYDALVREQITAPLGMTDTGVALTPAQTKRFVPGHAAGNAPQRAWDLDSLAGAGALRSTANDMLTYLDAQLHPDHVTAKTATGKTLPAAITASHELHGDAGSGMHIALNWFHIDEGGAFWHNGATGGYSAFAVFDPEHDLAVIVLFNRSIDDGSFADDLGKHVVRRLVGKPATTLSL